MDGPSPLTRDLARRLVALEAASGPVHPSMNDAIVVSDKLRKALTRLSGNDGFTALLRRAVALARAEAPALKDVRVTADGRLEGPVGELSRKDAKAQRGGSAEGGAKEGGGVQGQGKDGDEAAVAITAHLLWLLVTFIGEPLTLQLVREAWPEASFDKR